MSCPNCHQRSKERPKPPQTWAKKPLPWQKTMDRPDLGPLCYARWLTTVVGPTQRGNPGLNESGAFHFSEASSQHCSFCLQSPAGAGTKTGHAGGGGDAPVDCGSGSRGAGDSDLRRGGAPAEDHSRGKRGIAGGNGRVTSAEETCGGCDGGL